MNYFTAFKDYVEKERISKKHALFFNWQATTYGQLIEDANRLAGALKSCGIHEGDVVALYMNNCSEYITCLLGVAKLGGASMPIDVLLTRYEIRPMLEITKAKAVIVSPQYLHTVEELKPLLPEMRHVIVFSRECPPGTLSYFDMLKKAQPLPDAEARGDNDDTMLILFTSGTTGMPKGVPLTHNSLLFVIESMQERYGPYGEMVVLQPLPFSHVFGLHSITMCFLFQKTPSVIMDGWKGEEAAKLIQACRVSFLFVVPTITGDLLNFVDRYDLSSLKVITSGGSPLPPALAERAKTLLGVNMGNGLGLTEVSGMVATMPVGIPEKFGSIGLPLRGIEVKIFDENDNELPCGEIGEMVQRGPNNMKGYLSAPEATANTLRGGWLHTGDLAYMDKDGYIFWVDRKKDAIVRGGYKVYPTEVEAAIYQHPSVAEAAVFAVADERKGETVGAAVTPKKGKTLTSEEIIQHCQERLARYKVPKYVKIMDGLPKSATGKILRRKLRDMKITDWT